MATFSMIILGVGDGLLAKLGNFLNPQSNKSSLVFIRSPCTNKDIEKHLQGPLNLLG